MGQTVVLTGMVLSAMPIGEYDKRIQLLTKERGKIAAFARGARRMNSGLLAAANPFSFGEFEVFEGRNSYSVARASITNYFRELAADLEAVSYGYYFLEMALYYTQENMDGTDFLNLLYLTLKALLKPSLDNRLVRRIYELRVLVLAGEYPEVFSCVKCASKDGLLHFSCKRHGALCMKCLENEPALPMGDSARHALQYIITSRLEKLYTFGLREDVFGQVDEIIAAYMRQHIGHAFKSEELLRPMSG